MLEKPKGPVYSEEENITPEVAQTALPDEDAPEAYKLLYPIYSAKSGLVYPEPLVREQKAVHLDTTNTAVKVFKENMELLSAEEFTLVRHAGFGGSDAGVLLGVNPYTSLSEIIKQKASPTILPEEKGVGQEIAVIKGNDLEPLIIHKVEEVFDMRILKPTPMYQFKEWEYLFMNFDGVAGTPEQYFPVEIKVVTKRGERHYNPSTPIYDSITGWGALPEDISETNNSVQTKAALVGIPPYYYAQLQQEIMALNAPFGLLASLWENTWTLRVYFVYRDVATQNAIKIEGWKAFQQVLALREKSGWYN